MLPRFGVAILICTVCALAGIPRSVSSSGRFPDLRTAWNDRALQLRASDSLVASPADTLFRLPVVSARSIPPTPPELPRVFLNTDYVPATGATITVPAGGDFRAALSQAQPGDEIVLQAGATYTGNFVLPEKQGAGWIIVRSSDLSQLPAAGQRVTPTDAARMPKLVTPNSAPALKAPERVQHYRFVGIEITSAPSVTLTYNIVYLGGSQDSPADMPHDLIFDRVYVHGHGTLDTRRCFAVNGGATAIVDSYVSECHIVGFDSQAIGGWRGTGPYKVVNNHLEGAGENLMFGGGGSSPTWDVAADVEIRGNYFYKPLSWNRNHPTYAGKNWSVKNLFEIKDGQRWLIEGNIFENNWIHSQNGFAILYQAVDGVHAKITDITFRYNIVRYSPAGINCCGRHDNTGTRGLPSEPLQRIAFEHNLFYDIGVDGGVLGSHGRAVQLSGDHKDTMVRHNTFFGPRGASWPSTRTSRARHSWAMSCGATPRWRPATRLGTSSRPASVGWGSLDLLISNFVRRVGTMVQLPMGPLRGPILCF